MQKSHRGKSTARKPLRDVSNGGNLRRTGKKENPAAAAAAAVDDASGLDRLLLVRSDLASLIGQIDELVAHAIGHNVVSKKKSKDIDSFRHVLSDMHSSLKLWLPRLQQATTSASTPETCPKDTHSVSAAVVTKTPANVNGDVISSWRNESDLELVVSPSPLVSWHVSACAGDCGKQLFLLTPLPKTKVYSSKFQESSKSFVIKFNGQEQSNPHVLPPLSSSNAVVHDDPSGSVEVQQTLDSTLEIRNLSPLTFSNKKIFKQSSVCPLTPRFAKSSMALNPIPEPFELDDCNISMLVDQEIDAEELDEPSSDELMGSLTTKYQDLLGLQVASKFAGRRKEADETLDWFLSPPKTCVLMEPSDEKPVPVPVPVPIPVPTPINSRISFGTPIWKEFESTRKGKLAGEATLKRELWTKFEAASSSGLHFDVSMFRKAERKGFLDRLEEVSCETNDFDSRTTR